MNNPEPIHVLDEARQAWSAMGPLRASYVAHEQLATVLAWRGDSRFVAVASRELAHHCREMIETAGRRRGSLLLLDEPTLSLRAAFEVLFDRVIAPPATLLPLAELAEVLACEEASDLCIGGIVDQVAGVVALYRGDLSSVMAPLSSFASDGAGIEPDFSRFSVTDFGRTLCFGTYEAAFDAVLYERDASYRSRLKARRLAEDRSFGACLRRLRLQRGVAREDVPGVSAKTIARIERGEVARPRRRTLDALSRALGVAPDEIEQF